jgi:hypothetical protein
LFKARCICKEWKDIIDKSSYLWISCDLTIKLKSEFHQLIRLTTFGIKKEESILFQQHLKVFQSSYVPSSGRCLEHQLKRDPVETLRLTSSSDSTGLTTTIRCEVLQQTKSFYSIWKYHSYLHDILKWLTKFILYLHVFVMLF